MGEILNLFNNNNNNSNTNTNTILKDNQINLLLDTITRSTISYDAYLNLSNKIKDENITNFLFNALSFSLPTPECIELLKQQPYLLDILKNCASTPFDEIKLDIFLTCFNNDFNLIGELYYNIVSYVNKKYRNHLRIAGDATTNALFSVLHILSDPTNATNPDIINSFDALQYRLINNFVPNLKVIVKYYIDRFLQVKSGDFDIKIALSNNPISQEFWEKYSSQQALFDILQHQILTKIGSNANKQISTKIILNTANNYELIGYIVYVINTSNSLVIPEIYDIFIINEYRGIKISKSVLEEVINAYPSKCAYMIAKNSYANHNSIAVNQGFRITTSHILNSTNISSINNTNLNLSISDLELNKFKYGQNQKANSVIEWYCATIINQKMIENAVQIENLSVSLVYHDNKNIAYIIFDDITKVIHYINISDEYINSNIAQDLVSDLISDNQDIWSSSVSNQNFVFWREFKNAIILEDVVHICSDIKKIKKY